MLQRRILTALLTSAAFVSVAHAADLGGRAPPPPAPYVPAAPVFTWSGFYVGANVGGGFSDNNTTRYNYLDPLECGDAACDLPSSTVWRRGSTNNSGFLGGAQVGYNWQMNSMVLGLEADWDFAS